MLTRIKLAESNRDVGGEGRNMTPSLSEPEYTMLARPAERSGGMRREAYMTAADMPQGPGIESSQEGKWNNLN